MLTIDLASWSEKELEDTVASHCSLHGAVKNLRIYQAASPLARPFALVDMETAEQAESLAAAYGRRRMGNSVVIVLRWGRHLLAR